MAIVPKTDPKGVDVVIDAIQNYLYPTLIGAGWTAYECYPRANKNIRGTDVIPEVSRDVKDYEEVFLSDKVNATSFFLPSDVVPFNNDEQWIQTNVDIIFQVELPKLFPLVTDHRADEELHAQLMQILTDNDELFVEVVGYEIGVDNVYNGLTIGTELKSKTTLDDIGKFHVVKFTVTVRYPADDCEVVYSPTCDPVEVVLNTTSFGLTPNGQSKVIPVLDTNDLVVGVKEGDLFRVPAGGGSPVTTDFNGTPTGEDTPDGENLAINVVDIIGNPIGTLEVNDANEKEIEVLYPVTTTDVNGDPTGVDTAAGNNISFRIYDQNTVLVPYVLIQNTINNKGARVNIPVVLNTANPYKTGQTSSARTGDDGDTKRGRGTDFLTLDSNNFFGNTVRFTDKLDSQVYATDWVIDWSTWDQVTGDFLEYYRIPVASNWNVAVDAQPYTQGPHSDGMIPNITELYTILNWGTLNGGLDYPPFNIVINSTATRVWSTTYRPNATTVAMTATNTGNILGTSKTTVCQSILVRTGNTNEL